MIGFFAGVPGKLATLLARLSSARAILLDNLDAAITTRAPSSTALTSATWTNARAAKLDYLDAAISGITTMIQSVQYGTLTWGTNTAPTASISSVVVAKSVLINLGTSASGSAGLTDMGNITLTSSTVVTGSRVGNVNGCHTKFVVVEFK